MELLSISDIFTKRIFRIPSYQRGYAWRQDEQETQLGDFWEDLSNINNLDEKKKYYTGMITLKRIPDISPEEGEHWLYKDHGYKVYHVVDGQQRLTTTIILLQSMIELMREINTDKSEDEYIYEKHQLKGDY